jgi:DNA primase
MISKDTISLVRDRTDIVALVSEMVPSLKRRGRRFVGLCPFHKEKTPSFHVNPDNGIYHCFGCKESGDAFSLLERVEGYTFVEAVRALAERAGIPIEEERGASPTDAERHKKERESFYGAMHIAAAWFELQLREHPQRSAALDELARRNLPAGGETASAFQLGYAPEGWDGLATFLKKQHVSPAIGEAVGLLVPRSSGSGYYDRFRHRLMFAVLDVQGRVVAFSGRALASARASDGESTAGTQDGAPRDPPPKYINSPESPIYTKGATLFGLWQARHAIRQVGRAIVVEGNFDVVSLHARGVHNAVAPLGTAFTTDQAKILRRYASDVTLLFDGDAAGRKAARAAEDPCEQAGLDAKVALLPLGTDPDEYVRTKGDAGLLHIVAQARGLLEYLIDVELDDSFNAADLRDRVTRIDRVATVLARQRDPVVRGMLKAYADYAASRLDLVRSAPDAFGALERKVVNAARAARVQDRNRPSAARVKHRAPGYEERKAIVGALLDYSVLLDDSAVRETLGLLEGESARIVATMTKCTRISARGEKVLDTAEFLAQLPAAIQAFASARLAAPAHDTLEEARASVIANAKKLRETNVARETLETVREQRRVVGDWNVEVELAQHVDALVRQRQGLIRR